MAAINWEDEYGEKWSAMTPEQKDTTIVNMFTTLGRGQTRIEGKFDKYCEEQYSRNKFFNRASLTVVIAVPALFTALIILFTVLTNHIGK
jgi:hypothetical protein